MRTRKGFALGLMILAVILASLSGCARGSKEHAQKEMKTYVEEMGWTYVGGSCAGSDSDGDGYISCNANVRETPDGPPVEKALQCANGSIADTTSGCKPTVTPLFGGSGKKNK